MMPADLCCIAAAFALAGAALCPPAAKPPPVLTLDDDWQRRSEPGPLRQSGACRGAHLPAYRHRRSSNAAMSSR